MCQTCCMQKVENETCQDKHDRKEKSSNENVIKTSKTSKEDHSTIVTLLHLYVFPLSFILIPPSFYYQQ